MTNYNPDTVTICLYLAIPEEAETRREFAPWPRRLALGIAI